MARISIVHSTEYAYRNPVGLMRHRLMLRPDDSHDLRLNHAALDVDPKPSLVHWTHDAFDNSICFVEWPEQLRTKRQTPGRDKARLDRGVSRHVGTHRLLHAPRRIKPARRGPKRPH